MSEEHHDTIRKHCTDPGNPLFARTNPIMPHLPRSERDYRWEMQFRVKDPDSDDKTDAKVPAKILLADQGTSLRSGSLRQSPWVGSPEVLEPTDAEDAIELARQARDENPDIALKRLQMILWRTHQMTT